MPGVSSQVAQLVRVALEIEELFEDRVLFEVAGVDEAPAPHSHALRDLLVVEEVFVQEVRAPCRLLPAQERSQVQAVVALWDREPREAAEARRGLRVLEPRQPGLDRGSVPGKCSQMGHSLLPLLFAS